MAKQYHIRPDDPWIVQAMMRAMLPPDPNRPRSLFMALKRGLVPKQFLQAALEIERRLDECYPRRPKTCAPSGPNHNDPGWDNVIRAYEEDR
jgi:hypothetical protein